MFLFYVDESGNTGLNLDSRDQPVHWMVALGVAAEAMKSAETELLVLALRTFRDAALRPEFEFQGASILGGRGPFGSLSAQQRVQLYAELLAVIRKNDCALFAQGIDKARLRRRALARGEEPVHPHKLALTYLLERIDGWLGEAQPEQDLFQDIAGPPLYGLIIADEEADADRDLVQPFAYWREGATELGTRPELRFLLDTVHFVPSRESWLMQLVDCVAHVRAGYERVLRERGWNETAYTADERALARLWREHCADSVIGEYRWP